MIPHTLLRVASQYWSSRQDASKLERFLLHWCGSHDSEPTKFSSSPGRISSNTTEKHTNTYEYVRQPTLVSPPYQVSITFFHTNSPYPIASCFQPKSTWARTQLAWAMAQSFSSTKALAQRVVSPTGIVSVADRTLTDNLIKVGYDESQFRGCECI